MNFSSYIINLQNHSKPVPKEDFIVESDEELEDKKPERFVRTEVSWLESYCCVLRKRLKSSKSAVATATVSSASSPIPHKEHVVLDLVDSEDEKVITKQAKVEKSPAKQLQEEPALPLIRLSPFGSKSASRTTIPQQDETKKRKEVTEMF